MTMAQPLSTLVHSPELSSYRESLFVQIFTAELLQGCWLASLPPVEIDRPEVDFAGYDLTATCQLVTRHIQLKATRVGVSVHRALAEKPSGCVINLLPTVDEGGQRITFRYRFYGGSPGQPLDLKDLKSARKPYHTKDESGTFRKAERQHHVVVPLGRFEKAVAIVQLAHQLFGAPHSRAE